MSVWLSWQVLQLRTVKSRIRLSGNIIFRLRLHLFPPPSHRDATTTSPCWAPYFMTQERIMFSNPNPSEPRLSPAATMSDDTPSALTPSLHCASILQPAAPPQVVAFESCLLQFVSILSLLLNHENSIFEPVCVFYLFLFCLYFSNRNKLQL